MRRFAWSKTADPRAKERVEFAIWQLDALQLLRLEYPNFYSQKIPEWLADGGALLWSNGLNRRNNYLRPAEGWTWASVREVLIGAMVLQDLTLAPKTSVAFQRALSELLGTRAVARARSQP